MSLIATKYNIVADCAIFCFSHSKSETDVINSVDKNIIHKKLMSKHVHVSNVLKSRKLLKTHIYLSVLSDENYSTAKNCKKYLNKKF